MFSVKVRRSQWHGIQGATCWHLHATTKINMTVRGTPALLSSLESVTVAMYNKLSTCKHICHRGRPPGEPGKFREFESGFWKVGGQVREMCSSL